MGIFASIPYTCESSYENLEKNLDTGDLVFFSGNSGSFSFLIKLVTISPITHVGMVYKYNGKLCLWHSPNTPVACCPDILSGKFKDGPQLNKLKRALKNYNGTCMIRKLIKPNGFEKFDDEILFNFMKKSINSTYERSFIQLFLSVYDGPCGENYIDHSGYFCSELIAQTYQRLNILNKEKEDSEYTPADLDEDPLNNGFKLAKDSIFINRVGRKFL
jgi:hypothetical protein